MLARAITKQKLKKKNSSFSANKKKTSQQIAD